MSWLRTHRWRVAAVVITLAAVIAGKQFYRTASAEDLRFLLAPTARLVSWFTGGDFVYEFGAGYADYKIGFIIAPPCAGMNFALAAFVTLVFGGLGAITGPRALAVRLAFAAVSTYLATILVNTIRISIAVAQLVRNTTGSSTDVNQPLPMPEGVSDLAVGNEVGPEPGLIILLVIVGAVLILTQRRAMRGVK